MKIQVITTITQSFDVLDGEDKEANRILAFARPGAEISVKYIETGPQVIESEYEDAQAVMATVDEAIKAEKGGADAIVVNCTADTGLAQCRECVSIPVVGPAQSTMHLAAQLAHKFSVLSFLERVNPRFEEMAHRWGLAHKLVSVRSVEIPVSNVMGDKDHLVKMLFDTGMQCYREDSAHGLILGCTFFEAVADGIRMRFKQEGIPMLVLEPLLVAIRQAEILAAMNLGQSKLTYPYPGSLERETEK
jgi:allantoin racemase